MSKGWKGGVKEVWRSPFADPAGRGGCSGEKSVCGGTGSSRLRDTTWYSMTVDEVCEVKMSSKDLLKQESINIFHRSFSHHFIAWSRQNFIAQIGQCCSPRGELFSAFPSRLRHPYLWQASSENRIKHCFKSLQDFFKG